MGWDGISGYRRGWDIFSTNILSHHILANFELTTATATDENTTDGYNINVKLPLSSIKSH